MKTVYLIRVIAFFAIVTSLGGCGTRVYLESQLMAGQGPLSVVVHSDIEGGCSGLSGSSTPRCAFSFKEMDDIVVEHQGEETLLYVGKELRFRIPEKTQKLDIKVKNGNIAVKADGVLLPMVEDTEQADAMRRPKGRS